MWLFCHQCWALVLKKFSTLNQCLFEWRCAITASSYRLRQQLEMATMMTKEQEMLDTQAPLFLAIIWCNYCAWVSERLTICRHSGASYRRLLNKHTTSSLQPPPSVPPDLLPHSLSSVTFYGNDSPFFTLCAISPCLKFTGAQQGETNLTEHLPANRAIWRISLPCLHISVFYCRIEGFYG